MAEQSVPKIIKIKIPRKSAQKPLVAYFCMEYGLESDFKNYSGGLGILAGDLIKAARDANYPLVAVGILWRQGYTIQTIGENGLPVDSYPEYRYQHLKDTGVTVSVKIKESDVKCKVWLCDCYSNAPLLLLDAFLPGNPEQLITGQLYGWFEEERLAQEIILGVGGVRALDALGIKPDVYHFNEGHAVLAGMEMIRLKMAAQLNANTAAGAGAVAGAGAGSGSGANAGAAGVKGAAKGAGADAAVNAARAAASISAATAADVSAGAARQAAFQYAWDCVRKKIVFTTHTPVIAGNEFHGYRAFKYVGADLDFTEYELGQIGGDPFNMTVAGLRLSRCANAVAELHAATAKKMWAGVSNASDIIYVTNGVHNGTWQDREYIAAVKNYMSKDPKTCENAAKHIWSRHIALKNQLFEEVYARTGVRLNADCLTVGFARRAAPYKRSDLIFSNPGKIEGMFAEGRLQLIFSGKAHPNDQTGKLIVSNLVRMAKLYPDNVVFLQNYDMRIGALMTRGCDVWLNNPLRPQEASGTSGMKAAMNGVLNFSVLDGWWPEGCVHGENGWQIGECYEGEGADKADAESLYKVLEEEIIPTYYNNREKWIDMMANSVGMSQERFSAARMFDDYITKLYR